MIPKSTNALFLVLYDLQRAGVMVDTRLIVDDGELSINWSMLDLYGHKQWWSGLGEAGSDNVVFFSSHKHVFQYIFKYSCTYIPGSYQDE